MKRLGSMDTSMIFLLAMVIPILAILHSQILNEKTIFYKWLDSLSKFIYFYFSGAKNMEVWKTCKNGSPITCTCEW